MLATVVDAKSSLQYAGIERTIHIFWDNLIDNDVLDSMLFP